MRWMWLIALLLLTGMASAWANGVRVILSDSAPAYVELAGAMRSALGSDVRVEVLRLSELGAEQVRMLSLQGELLAPVGMQALRFVAQHAGPGAAVLAVMVPRAAATAVSWRHAPAQVAHVFVGQAPQRMPELAHALLPGRTRLAVIVSAENQAALADMRAAAERLGQQLAVARVSTPAEVGPALRRLMADHDVLLLIPDAVVLAGDNLRHLLMAGYRMRVPVLGYSAAVVRSGALAGVFSTPAQIGVQAAALARQWHHTRRLAGGQGMHAGRYSISINHHLARSLGLALPPPDEVARRLGAELHPERADDDLGAP